MRRGVSPVVATVLLIAIAVIASVTVWFWTSSYTAKPALAATAQKAYVVLSAYKNSSNDGCMALDIKNVGGTAINNLVLEVRHLKNGSQVDVSGGWLNDSSLVSYWKFDEDTNDEKNIINGTFYGETLNNGTFYGGASWTAGMYGNAAQFTGSNYAIAPNDSAFNLRYNGTITAWIKTSGTTKSTIAGKLWNVDPWPGWVMDTNQNTNNGRLCFWGGNGTSGGNWQCGNTNISNGVWQHVAVSWYNTSNVAASLTFYVNGTSDGTVAIRIPASNNQSLTIGMENSTAFPYALFNGTIDSLRIWNFPMSQAQIQTEMNSPYPIVRPIASWEFDEGTGNIANDTHTFTAGKYGSGINLDGMDDYVGISRSQTQNELTLSEWVYINKTSGSQGSIGTFAGWTPSGSSYLIWHDPHVGVYTRWRIQGTASTSPSVNYNVNMINAWTHVAATYSKSAGKMKLYINGALGVEDNFSEDVSYPAVEWAIGKYPGSFFNGTIDEVAVFNRSLSETEIARIYGGGLHSLDEALGPENRAYVNITSEIKPGETFVYNISSIGNSTRDSIPLGAYILRPSSYSSSFGGVSDRIFNCV